MTVIPANNSAIQPRKKWLLILLLLFTGAFGWYTANHFGKWKDRFVPRKLRTVDPGLMYASGQINRHLIRDVLTQNKIKVVIVLLGEELDSDAEEERAACKELNIQRFHYYLSGDGTGDINQYAGAVAKMAECEKMNTPTLVHCSSGMQRSNGATYFFRVLIQHRSAADALTEIENNGVDPHRDAILLSYLNDNIAKLAALLVDMKVIDRVPDPLPQIHP